MIVVTGATGHYGRKVIEGLSSRVPASSLGVSVRDTEKATDLRVKGIRVEKASFAAPATLAAALDGAEQVLLVSANVLGDEAIRLHGNAIQAAKNAGVKRILYTSHQAASPTSKGLCCINRLTGALSEILVVRISHVQASTLSR